MYISEVNINGFRNFENITIPFTRFTTIIGKNDEGKSNLLEAISLVLHSDLFNSKSKKLGQSDFNRTKLKVFNDFIDTNRSKIISEDSVVLSELEKLIPKIQVKLTFLDPSNDYEKGLLKDFIEGDEINQYYSIEYLFEPKDYQTYVKYIVALAKTDTKDFISIEDYKYDIYSVNNGKSISFMKRQSFQGNFIYAERDMFSQDNNPTSMDLVSKILEKTVNNLERSKIIDLYNKFFDGLKDLSSFKKLFDYLINDEESNLKSFIETLELKPNTPKFKSIFSNVKISYGDDYLYQKGLGKRNFMYIMLLFSYFNNVKDLFNLIAVEEPESHLSTDNLNLIMSFIHKSLKSDNTLTQFIITTHRPEVINKLKLDNVVIVNENNAISLKNVETDLVNYLSKRPNIDILKILFSKKLCLVEGVTEEMYVNTVLENMDNSIFDIDVISIGQRGFRMFLDIWLKVNKGTSNKILVIRDFDNLLQAKDDHDQYAKDNKNIRISTTSNYTFEDDFVTESTNGKLLSKMLNCEEKDVADKLKSDKANSMFEICQSISNKKLVLSIPAYIKGNIEWLKK